MKLTWHETLEPPLAAAWDEARDHLDLHPFQDRNVATARAAFFHQGLRFVTGHEGNDLVFGAAVAMRRSGPWPPRLAITRGPWAVDDRTLTDGILRLADSWPWRSPMSLRIDPHRPLPANDLETALVESGFASVPAEFHQATVCVDLTLDADAMWRSVRSTARNQIRRAERELTSTIGGLADAAEYIAFHAVAAEDKGYRSLDEGWLESLLQTGRAWLVLNRCDGKLVGAGVFGLGGRTVHYLYGARDRSFRGPSFYGAFWHVIQHAKAQGFARCDLGGLPYHNEGVAFFKRAFGGQELMFTDERECILRPVAQAGWHHFRNRLPQRWLG